MYEYLGLDVKDTIHKNSIDESVNMKSNSRNIKRSESRHEK